MEYNGSFKQYLVILTIFCSTLVSFVINADPIVESEQKTVMITGANRGLGLEFAKQFQSKGYRVIATARNPDKANELNKLGVRVETLDVASDESVAALAKSLDGLAIDLLINNAGIFPRADKTIDEVDFTSMQQVFNVNSIGPLRVTKALMPNLQSAESKTIISISSRLGSIELSNGAFYSYRSSKSALNQINKIWSKELNKQGFICVVLHPGWVKTDMGGSNAKYTPEESIAGMIKVIESLDKEDNGHFYDLNGETIPW